MADSDDFLCINQVNVGEMCLCLSNNVWSPVWFT